MDDDQTRRRPPEQATENLRYKVFTCTRMGFVWSKRQMFARWNETRDEVAAFVNGRVGVENVISVSESNFGDPAGFSVAVWYRGSLTSKDGLNFDGLQADDDLA